MKMAGLKTANLSLGGGAKPSQRSHDRQQDTHGQPDPMQTSVSYWGSREALKMADGHLGLNQHKGGQSGNPGGHNGSKKGGRNGRPSGKVSHEHGFASGPSGMGQNSNSSKNSRNGKKRPKPNFKGPKTKKPSDLV